MSYRQHIEHGAKGAKEFDAMLSRLDPALADLKARRDPLAAALLNLAARTDDLAAIRDLAGSIRRRFDHVIVAGAGGSCLSGECLAMLTPASERQPALHFIDTIDPHVIDDLFFRCRAGEIFYLLISKSGATIETLTHFHLFLDHARGRFGEALLRERFLLLTEAAENPLRRIAKAMDLPTLDHAPDIGGRFSALSNVGLLPAAIAGLDIAALREGAAHVVKNLDGAAAARDCPPAAGAALQCAHLEAGRNISVMLAYGERLRGIAAFYRQCWAESLGKQGKGSTPVVSIGPSDQHSQLQLYLDGPKDKLFTLVTLRRAKTGQTVRHYLAKKTTGDLMESQQRATAETLARHGCPVREIALDVLDEYAAGALLMHLMLEVIFAARLLNVNPFDQPAIEEGKALARAYLEGGGA